MHGLLIALVTVAAVAVASGAGMADAVTVAVKSGLVCDTADQVEAFAVLPSDMPVDRALAEINAKAGDPQACMLATVAVRAVAPVRTVTAADGRPIEIVSAEVIGAADSAGVWHLFPPQRYFMLRRVHGHLI